MAVEENHQQDEEQSDPKSISKTDQLKRLPSLLGSAKISQRNEGFDILNDLIEEETDFSEIFIKGISLLLVSQITSYHDHHSHHMLLSTLEMVVLRFGPQCKPHFINGITHCSQQFSKDTDSSLSLGRYHSYHFAAVCHLWHYLSEAEVGLDSHDFDSLVSSLSIFFNLSCFPSSKPLLTKLKANAKLILQKESDREGLFTALTTVPCSLHMLFVGGWLLSVCKELHLSSPAFHECKAAMIRYYISAFLLSKKRPDMSMMEKGAFVLHLISEEEFSTSLKPGCLKGLLKAPEALLWAVGGLFSHLRLDLTPHVKDFMKVVTNSLSSGDETVREGAAFLCERLAIRLEDANGVGCLVVAIGEALNGVHGKLPSNAHKINICKILQRISQNGVKNADAAEELAREATIQTLPFLVSEKHEGSVLEAITALSAWVPKPPRIPDAPQQLVDFMPKILSSMANNGSSRAAFFNLLFLWVNEKSVDKLKMTTLNSTQALDRTIKQGMITPWLQEGLSISTFLLKMLSFGTKDPPKVLINSFYCVDVAQSFPTDKFLVEMSASARVTLMRWSAHLLTPYFYPRLLERKGVNLALSVLVRSLFDESAALRRESQAAVKILCRASVGSSTIHLEVIEEIEKYVLEGLAVLKKKSWDPQEEDEPTWNGIATMQAIVAIFEGREAIPEGYRDAEMTLQKAVRLIFDPSTAKSDGGLWQRVCRLSGVNARTFMDEFDEFFFEVLFTGDDMETLQDKKFLANVLRFGGPNIYSGVVDHFMGSIHTINFSSASDEDVAIFRTPMGTLYDKSIVKRMMDKEKTKKGLEGVKVTAKDKPKLTAEQKEIVYNHIRKEDTIRRRLGLLDAKCIKWLQLLEAAAEGSPSRMLPLIKAPIGVLIEFFPNNLIGHRMGSTFMDIRNALFEPEDTFAHLVGQATLRIFNCAMEFPSDWLSEPIGKACYRAIFKIHQRVVKKDYTEDELLTAPAFCYCFPLLEFGLAQWRGKDTERKEKIGIGVLRIFQSHLAMRGSSFLGSQSLYHPKGLPRQQLLRLLLNVLRTREGRVQQMSSSLLTEVCLCGDGSEGCDILAPDEVLDLTEAMAAEMLFVRDAAIRAIRVIVLALDRLDLGESCVAKLTYRLYVARCDEDETYKALADELWKIGGFKVKESHLALLQEDLSHDNASMRLSAAGAITALQQELGMDCDVFVKRFMDLYRKKNLIIPERRNYRHEIIRAEVTNWEWRCGAMLALRCLTPHLTQEGMANIVRLALPEALSDPDEKVRQHVFETTISIVNFHGHTHSSLLMSIFESYLSSVADESETNSDGEANAMRQSVVVLMGSLAAHLDPDSPKVKPIVYRLLKMFNTPSELVQESVSSCIPALVPVFRSEAKNLVEGFFNKMKRSNDPWERLGAAYGVASIVKGMGILSLKQLDVMNNLTSMIKREDSRYRESALQTLEQLCRKLGRLFEPYVIHVLPSLLNSFGDTNANVRRAAENASKALMSKLSTHGVKLVLPSLRTGLKSDSWRIKRASVTLLGRMAYCAPKQLSACLPSIVPSLIAILRDTHMLVSDAGEEALKAIGSVIRNPEIKGVVPIMLAALEDPFKHTSECLQTLLETKFVHVLDAASLALIMPVVQRAFQDRSTEVRKMAAMIIGNMYSLTDQRDLAPYLPSVIPGLKVSLLDPVPKVRSVSAKALGAMIRGMGESCFSGLLPWLMTTLTSDTSSVDRSGAAQGLAEVLGALGPQKLHKLMPEVISTAKRTDIAPHVKDGYIMMFIYLPGVFQEEFTPYIGAIIPPILNALADENEFVRETALQAGKKLIGVYAESAVMLLLPELERGLLDDNCRIRFSSVQLVGELLFRVSGVSGKMSTLSTSDDDNFGTEQSQKAIKRVLGEERRNRVLAGLYMGRSDVSLMVRQAALHVWKVVVTNTPKTLREILSTLFSLLLSCLASTNSDKRQVAARTLGDLVRKLGERVLPEIIPILEAGLDSEDPDHRQGVCVGLSEIMASTSKDMVTVYVNNLVPTVRRALCDPLPTVREAAGHTFDSLHSTVGSKALDDILPHLLKQLNENATGDDPEELEAAKQCRENALDGLKQVMTIKSRVVLPYLVPQLTRPPVNTEALCLLASVAGSDSLTRHLNRILPALLTALVAAAKDNERYEATLTHCQQVILAVNDEAGVGVIVDELLVSCKSRDHQIARASVALLLVFCSHSRADYTDFSPPLVRGFVQMLVSPDSYVVQTAWDALNAVTKRLEPADQRALVPDVRQAVKFAASDLRGGQLIPGFCLPKGIQPILPIFREAVLNGDPEQKESASNGLTEVIRVSSPDALKSSVVHVTGPLIRILGDRFAWSVKVAVLDTLALLLEKTGPMLKPFLPQLQTTFVKAASDPNRVVRLRAAAALAHLVAIHAKPDPLFTELLNMVKATEDAAFKETMLQSVRSVVGPAGFRLSDGVRKSLLTHLLTLLFHEGETVRLCAAGALGQLTKWLPPAEMQEVTQCLFDTSKPNWHSAHGRSAALFSVLYAAPERLIEATTASKVANALSTSMTSDHVTLIINGLVGFGFFLKWSVVEGEVTDAAALSAFSKSINHANNDVKQCMCRVSQYVAEAVRKKATSTEVKETADENEDLDGSLPEYVLKAILPMLVNGTKEKNQVVRSAAEMALIAVLRLKEGQQRITQSLMKSLEGGAKASLQEATTKIVKKAQPYGLVKEAEMDISILL